MESKVLTKNEEMQLVVFALGEEEYGIPILNVQEIKKVVETARVPHTPSYIKGVMNLRGSIVPVIDLKDRLQLPETEMTEEARIIVIKADEVTVGFMVDAVSEVVSLMGNQIEPPPSHENISGVNSAFINGVGKKEERLIILLDLEEIIYEKNS